MYQHFGDIILESIISQTTFNFEVNQHITHKSFENIIYIVNNQQINH